jgi:hypothetical protein
MKNNLLTLSTIILMMTSSCHNRTESQPPVTTPSGSFGFDLIFLKARDSGLVVLQHGESKIIISPKYQAKVFTSTADGDAGTSFGWVHYKAFDGPEDPHMNAYGGENRLWLGPEGGKFSLFFRKDSSMIVQNWKTPAPIDTEPWDLTYRSDSSVLLEKNMQIENYVGTKLQLKIFRRITLLDKNKINDALQITADPLVKSVGYETENTISNTGEFAWDENTGTPCLWILDMFNPSDNTTIVIPYQGDTTKPATTDYFGEIPNDRITYKNGVLFFKADGRLRGKLGIHPARAMNMAGSYDPGKNILTITRFDVDNGAHYLNQEWNTTKLPFSGDAINAYNDGPLSTGLQMGPFYELESVSPAALLQPGTALTHHHSVFHFTGDEQSLDTIAQKTLGVSLNQIKNALK